VTSTADSTVKETAPAPGEPSTDRRRRRLQGVKLTARQLTCLSLYYFDNLSTGQIASELRIHRTVVSQHLRYGRRKLSGAGLTPKRLRWPAQPVLIQMDMEGLDKFDPESLAARW